jgi:ABC-2 type transport system ATP-binding protein
MNTTATSNAPLLQVRDLAPKFGNAASAPAITFDVPRGQLFGIVGPSGSGKSTTVRMLAGIVAPASGCATGFNGLDLVRDAERWRQRTGYVSRRAPLYLDLTVRENLQFFGSIHRLPAEVLRDRVADAAEQLQIVPFLDSTTSTLSIAQRQRAALAAAVLHAPELLLLDEPTAGLDARARRMLWQSIDTIAASRGTTVVVTTRDMDDAAECHRLALLVNGTLIADEQPPTLGAAAAASN